MTLDESTAAAVFRIEWRRPSTDDRIVGGIAVPWNETSYLTDDPKGERFLPGSLTRSVKYRGDRLKLFRGAGGMSDARHMHDAPIGRVAAIDARHPDGLYTQWTIAKTPAGDAALEEIAEGMLDAFSIGFRAVRAQRGQDGAREITEAEVHEVSILPIGAYDGARVLEVRAPNPVVGGRPALAELDAWLEGHPTPDVVPAPWPELRTWRP